MTPQQTLHSPLVYAKEVLGDRINVYQLPDENSFAALEFVSPLLVRVEDHHSFAELWVSAEPATERPIGEDPRLGSVRTIFIDDQQTLARVSAKRAVLTHGAAALRHHGPTS